MMSRWRSTIISVNLALSLAIGVPHVAMSAETGVKSTVTVDTAQAMGPLPYLFRAGVFLNEYPLDYPFSAFFSELKPGLVQVMPVKDAFDIGSLAEYVRQLPSFPSTKWAMETQAKGGKVIIGLTEMPKWLRQAGGDGYLRPPRDLAGWSEFVEANVRFFNGTLKLDAMFVLWDEPDSPMFWKKASERDYFALYQAFVVGARRADPAAKVGGPATSWWGAKGPGSDGKQPMLKNFIDYCAQTAAPEVGLKKLPLDFIVWHQFNTDPKGDPLLYTVPVKQVKDWLTAGGYDPATPLINGSWNTWLNFGKDPNELSSERDTEFAAAYVVNALVAMDQAGIAHHNFFNLFEGWQWKSMAQDRRAREFGGKELFGGFGLFGRSALVKPAFNAFKAFSLMEGTRVRTSTNDPYLSVVASSAPGVMYVLVGNFTWPGEGLMALKGRTLLSNGFPLNELADVAKVMTPQVVQELESQKRALRSLPLSERAQKELEALGYLDELYRGRDREKTVSIKIEKMPWAGDTEVDRYLVDREHGNVLQAGKALVEFQQLAVKRVQADVGGQLRKWNLLGGDFPQWDEARQGREIQSAIPRLSGEQRRKVDELVQAVTGQTLKEFNEKPEVGLAKLVHNGAIMKDGALLLDAPVMPYSVNLFVLREKRK